MRFLGSKRSWQLHRGTLHECHHHPPPALLGHSNCHYLAGRERVEQRGILRVAAGRATAALKQTLKSHEDKDLLSKWHFEDLSPKFC